MTILYNKATKEVIGYYPQGYKVNGKPSPTYDPDVVELVVVEAIRPVYDEITHRAVIKYEVDLKALKYVQVYDIVQIPEPTTEEYNAQMEALRAEAYRVESDPLALKYLRDECTKQEWLDKIAEIRNKYPYKA
jgi:hypothetical protein